MSSNKTPPSPRQKCWSEACSKIANVRFAHICINFAHNPTVSRRSRAVFSALRRGQGHRISRRAVGRRRRAGRGTYTGILTGHPLRESADRQASRDIAFRLRSAVEFCGVSLLKVPVSLVRRVPGCRSTWLWQRLYQRFQQRLRLPAGGIENSPVIAVG